MRLRKRRTSKMVSIDEDIETEEGTVPRDLADWAPDPEQNYNQAELAEILRKTIQGLPQGFRVVFVLRDVEGLSTEETAETLGPEHSGRQVAPAARPFAIARAPEPLLPQEEWVRRDGLTGSEG